jgi:hypothetical protein
MQTATQNPCASVTIATPAKPVKVFHATRNIQMEFDPSMTAEWGVAYAYCEENLRMSELFAHRDAGTLSNMYAKLPMTYGKRSVACGDWMACVLPGTSKPAPVVTAGDIQNVLEQYSLRVTDTQGKSFETMAAELVDTLDLASVIAAADTGDTPVAKQQAVFDALHQLLVKEGVIEF